jgi:hypothetical protein
MYTHIHVLQICDFWMLYAKDVDTPSNPTNCTSSRKADRGIRTWFTQDLLSGNVTGKKNNKKTPGLLENPLITLWLFNIAMV